jgi:predicted DNA-binding ribbon-helix-helix protein
VINGHKTSVGLEDDFWTALKEIASDQGLSMNQLVSSIEDQQRQGINISSAIRLYVLEHYRRLAENAPVKGNW